MKTDSTPEDPHSLVDLAMRGDEEAIKLVCKIAGRSLQTGETMHPVIHAYIAGSIARRGHGSNFRVAFSPLSRVDPETTAMRRRMEKMARAYWVDHARALGLATSSDGDPGPAFEEAAKGASRAPSTMRKSYYQAKEAGVPDFRENCKKR